MRIAILTLLLLTAVGCSQNTQQSEEVKTAAPTESAVESESTNSTERVNEEPTQLDEEAQNDERDQAPGIYETEKAKLESQVTARDTKRIADMKSLQTTLELYYNEEGEYPNPRSWMRSFRLYLRRP